MLYTYEYDTAYHGPALPVVEMEISAASESHRRIVIRALVDSGADATMIPVRYLHQVGAKATDKRRIRNSSNVSYQVEIYAISLRIGPYATTAIEVLGNRQSDDVILGRDVLNQLIVTLNGLANVVEISQ